VLTYPAYKGTTIWNRLAGNTAKREKKDIEDWVISENTHEAIIDTETWEGVQRKTNQKRSPTRVQKNTHLLSGILKCGLCGSGMSYDRAGSKNNKYGIYRCSTNKQRNLFGEGLSIIRARTTFLREFVAAFKKLISSILSKHGSF
jgi:site-specific DNA recombinase